jgi:hypothetical protein
MNESFRLRPTVCLGFPVCGLTSRMPCDTPILNIEQNRNRQGLPSSWHFFARIPRSKVDPGRPSRTSPNRSVCVGFCCVKSMAVCISSYRGCIKLKGVRSPLRSACFPVYASTDLFGFGLLSSSCNTRYEWLVKPCSAGTFTLQEAPSFAWRTNAECLPTAIQVDA